MIKDSDIEVLPWRIYNDRDIECATLQASYIDADEKTAAAKTAVYVTSSELCEAGEDGAALRALRIEQGKKELIKSLNDLRCGKIVPKCKQFDSR